MPEIKREQEIAEGIACWMWDWLRKTGAGGFMLALSGGIDSSLCALLIKHMCHKLLKSDISPFILGELMRITGQSLPGNAADRKEWLFR